MKKFTKVAIILSGVFLVIAIGCVIVAVSMGLTWGGFTDMVENNRFNLTFDEDSMDAELDVEPLTDEESVETITQDFANLEVEFGEGTLEIVYEDVEAVQIEYKNLSNYKCYVKENTLHIVSKSKIHIGSEDGTLCVILPKNMVLNEVDVEIGAGVAKIEKVVANAFDISVGAGKADVTEVDVKELDAEVGAGLLKLLMAGSEADYSYEAEYGIGKLTIGQTEISGVGGEKNFANPGAGRNMDLECGVGELIVEFQN